MHNFRMRNDVLTGGVAPSQERRFACTACGACCNRSPEVALSEANRLADVFVFRLMFRLYCLSEQPSASTSSAAFFERKRLLTSYAARKWSAKETIGGRKVPVSKYLVISALTLDAGLGACSALSDKTCGIHARRPLSCRSVPFHYARPEASAGTDLDAFVGTAGFGCDTGETAPIVLQDGRIVAPGFAEARAEARAMAQKDLAWSRAIVRRMAGDPAYSASLPSLRDVEASAGLGALTASMRVAWLIASDLALITRPECDGFIGQQLDLIDRQLGKVGQPAGFRQSLHTLQVEYRDHLNGR